MHDLTKTRARSALVNPATMWLAAAFAFFICEAIAAASVSALHPYSYTKNFISELGVPGRTPLAVVMNVGFWLQGLLFLGGAILAARQSATGHRRLFVGLAGLNALGDVLVATFHGNALALGNNGAAALHWYGALFGIIGGNAAVITGSKVVAGLVTARWYRRVSVILGVAGILSLLIIGNPTAQLHPGIWERGSVYSILLWQVLSATLLLAQRRTDTVRRVAR